MAVSIAPAGKPPLQKDLMPDYLHEALFSIRCCCPGFLFKSCPVLIFSCFGSFCKGILKCILAPMFCLARCICSVCLRMKKCMGCCFSGSGSGKKRSESKDAGSGGCCRLVCTPCICLTSCMFSVCICLKNCMCCCFSGSESEDAGSVGCCHLVCAPCICLKRCMCSVCLRLKKGMCCCFSGSESEDAGSGGCCQLVCLRLKKCMCCCFRESEDAGSGGCCRMVCIPFICLKRCMCSVCFRLKTYMCCCFCRGGKNMSESEDTGSGKAISEFEDVGSEGCCHLACAPCIFLKMCMCSACFRLKKCMCCCFSGSGNDISCFESTGSRGCCNQVCTPCIFLKRCMCSFCLILKKCVCMFNVCNISCGLPCYSPPGCVCIFPSTLCGFGLTCPYFCCSCGFKHCCKMPEQERAYWRTMKESKKIHDDKQSKEDKPGLVKEMRDIEMGGNDTNNSFIVDGPTLLVKGPSTVLGEAVEDMKVEE